jgi:hypothetical protein
VLRYRMVVHDGTLTPGAIDKIWKSFAKKKLETP